MVNQDFRVKLQLNLIHAFLGKIDPKVRGIQIDYQGDNHTKINCYFDGEVTEIDKNETCTIESEIISGFCSPYNKINVWFEIIRLDSPTPLPWDNSTEWFYLKKETWINL
jgi:hypothetical protein